MRVAVVDSGWTEDQRDSRVRPGIDWSGGAPQRIDCAGDDTRDLIGHGTRCTKLILALAPHAEITPVRIFYDRLETSPSVLLSALDWTATRCFDIVNLSLSTTRVDARDALYSACARLQSAGSIIVAATNGTASMGYPAAFDNVIAVAVETCEKRTGTAGVAGRTADLVLRRGWFGAPLRHPDHHPMTSSSAAAAFVSGCLAQQCRRHGAPNGSQLAEILRRWTPLGAALAAY